MALNIKNDKVERLAEELAKRPFARALDFLEREVWPTIPRTLLGRGVTKRERERILGYGKGGL